MTENMRSSGLLGHLKEGPLRDRKTFLATVKKYTIQPVINNFEELCKRCDSRLAVILMFVWPDAASVLRHIEDHILRENGDGPMKVKKQFLDDCTMLSVASAIVAQVAVTAISLEDLNYTRYTAKAAFIISLVTSSLSVYFACRLQQKLTNMLSNEDVKDFLSKQSKKSEIAIAEDMNHKITELHELGKQVAEDERRTDAMADLETVLKEVDGKLRWHSASASAAYMIKIPGLFLNVAVITLLVGLGVYLKDTSSHKTWVIFMVFACSGPALYYGPWVWNHFRTRVTRHWDDHKSDRRTSIFKLEFLRPRQVRSIDEDLKKAQALATEIREDYEEKIEKTKEMGNGDAQAAETDEVEDGESSQHRRDKGKQRDRRLSKRCEIF